MPGWQIVLIAVGAALLAATVAVLWTARGPRAVTRSQRPPEACTQTERCRTDQMPGGTAPGRPKSITSALATPRRQPHGGSGWITWAG
jgi:hypothetical protein